MQTQQCGLKQEAECVQTTHASVSNALLDLGLPERTLVDDPSIHPCVQPCMHTVNNTLACHNEVQLGTEQLH